MFLGSCLSRRPQSSSSIPKAAASSTSARLWQTAQPTLSVYSATKGAVDTITASLAQELGPKKIRVNSLNPGMVETEGTHAAGFIGSDFQKLAESRTPLGRIGQPQDIATAAALLASDDSAGSTARPFTPPAASGCELAAFRLHLLESGMRAQGHAAGGLKS